MKKRWHPLLWCLLVIYGLFVADMLFFSRIHGRYFTYGRSYQPNLIPLRTILSHTKGLIRGLAGETTHGRDAVYYAANLLGNLFLFAPMGVALPLLSSRFLRLWSVGLTVLGTVLLLELLQFVFQLGCFDVDDILLNVTGALLGYGLFSHIPVKRSLECSRDEVNQ